MQATGDHCTPGWRTASLLQGGREKDVLVYSGREGIIKKKNTGLAECLNFHQLSDRCGGPSWSRLRRGCRGSPRRQGYFASLLRAEAILGLGVGGCQRGSKQEASLSLGQGREITGQEQ